MTGHMIYTLTNICRTCDYVEKQIMWFQYSPSNWWSWQATKHHDNTVSKINKMPTAQQKRYLKKSKNIKRNLWSYKISREGDLCHRLEKTEGLLTISQYVINKLCIGNVIKLSTEQSACQNHNLKIQLLLSAMQTKFLVFHTIRQLNVIINIRS